MSQKARPRRQKEIEEKGLGSLNDEQLTSTVVRVDRVSLRGKCNRTLSSLPSCLKFAVTSVASAPGINTSLYILSSLRPFHLQLSFCILAGVAFGVSFGVSSDAASTFRTGTTQAQTWGSSRINCTT